MCFFFFIWATKWNMKNIATMLTCAKFDCFDGSFRFGMCALNCLERVTDRANFANFDKPINRKKGEKKNKSNEIAISTYVHRNNHRPNILNWELPLLLSSASITCLKWVISRNVSSNSTTKSRSLRIGATWSRSHNGVSAKWNPI